MSRHGPNRPRTTNTCRECKRRKLRCDQVRPSCTRCTSAPGMVCIYDSDAPREFQFVPMESSIIHRSRPEVSASTVTDFIEVPADRLKSLEQRLESLTGMVQSLQSSRTSEVELSEGSGEQSQSAKRIRQSPTESALTEAEQGHLDVQAGGRTRYVSRNFWASVCDEASEIEALLRSQTRYEVIPDLENLPNHPWRRGSLAVALLSAPPATEPVSRKFNTYQQQISANLTNLPDKSYCDRLLDAYIWNFHPIVPLIHVPSFRKEYERFWDLRSESHGQKTTQSTPLILAALFAGSVVCSNREFEQHPAYGDHEEATLQLYWMSSRALSLSGFPRVPTVESLSAYLIIQGTWLREEEPLTTCSFVGVAVRVAQMLGLNREPSLFKSSISLVAAEVRRRVWWHCFHLDVLVAMASGLPPLIDRDSFDVHKISELREEYIGTVIGLQYEEDLASQCRQPADPMSEPECLVSPLGIYTSGKIEDTLISRKLLNKTFGTSPMTLNDIIYTQRDLEDFGAQTAKRIARIPYMPVEETYESNREFNTWARLLLSAFGDQNWWFMHSQLLHRSISQAWNEVLPSVVYHCRAFLEKFVCLASMSDFERFQWAWPGNHQPLHAIMTLLKEVERDPYGVEAAASRSIIDQVMALCGPEGGLSGTQDGKVMPRPLTEGGKEAWDLIKRLRSRAWIKAGLDPDVVSTREEAAEKARDQYQLQTAHSLTVSERFPRLQSSPLSEALEASEQPLGVSGVPTPNLNWEDWDTMFGMAE